MSYCYPNINTDSKTITVKGVEYTLQSFCESEMECCEGICQTSASVSIERNGEYWGSLEINIFTWNENGIYCFDCNDSDMRFIDIDGLDIEDEEVPREVLNVAQRLFNELGEGLESYTADLLEEEAEEA